VVGGQARLKVPATEVELARPGAAPVDKLALMAAPEPPGRTLEEPVDKLAEVPGLVPDLTASELEAAGPALQRLAQAWAQEPAQRLAELPQARQPADCWIGFVAQTV